MLCLANMLGGMYESGLALLGTSGLETASLLDTRAE